MRRTLIALVVASSLPAFASSTSYELDPAHTAANFAVRHMMVSNVHGQFSKVSGTVEVDDKDAKKSNVEASIDASTINTSVDKRDAHLKSADFFDVQKYPNITFKSTKVARAGSDKDGATKYNVEGDLTMHGVTKPVTLKVSLTKPVKDMMAPSMRRGLTATAKLNREDFGLTWNKALEGGGVLVGKDITIEINGEMLSKAEATAKTEAPAPASGAAKAPAAAGASGSTKEPAKATAPATK